MLSVSWSLPRPIRSFTTLLLYTVTAQKMKFSIKDFFSKCDQIRRKLRIWSHLLKKSLMENFFVQCVSAKLTGKHLCQNFIKNVSLEHVFSCEFCTLVLSVGGADSLQWIFPHAFFLYISKTNLVLRAILLKSRKLEN